MCEVPNGVCSYVYVCVPTCASMFTSHCLAVSGAHNTIVTARAGKDLISSVTSGLLTIVR